MSLKQIAFYESGRGTDVLLLHGNPGTRNDFQKLIKLLPTDKLKIIAVDRPGHGESINVPNLNNGVFDSMKLYKYLINKKFKNKFYIIAYSLGAYFTLRLMKDFSDKIKGIILISPFIEAKKDDKASGVPNLCQIPLVGSIFKMILPIMAKSTIKKHIADGFSPIVPDDKWQKDLLRQYLSPDSLVATMADKNQLIKEPLTEEIFNKIKCPVLVFNGNMDKKNPGHVETIKKHLPDAEIITIKGSGHAVLFSKTDEISEKIVEFINSNND